MSFFVSLTDKAIIVGRPLAILVHNRLFYKTGYLAPPPPPGRRSDATNRRLRLPLTDDSGSDDSPFAETSTSCLICRRYHHHHHHLPPLPVCMYVYVCGSFETDATGVRVHTCLILSKLLVRLLFFFFRSFFSEFLPSTSALPGSSVTALIITRMVESGVSIRGL